MDMGKRKKRTVATTPLLPPQHMVERAITTCTFVINVETIGLFPPLHSSKKNTIFSFPGSISVIRPQELQLLPDPHTQVLQMLCGSNNTVTWLFSTQWAHEYLTWCSPIFWAWASSPWNIMNSDWCHVLTLTLCQNVLHVWPSRRVQIHLCSFRLGVSRLWVSTHLASTLDLVLLPQISAAQITPTSPSSLPQGPQKKLTCVLHAIQSHFW